MVLVLKKHHGKLVPVVNLQIRMVANIKIGAAGKQQTMVLEFVKSQMVFQSIAQILVKMLVKIMLAGVNGMDHMAQVVFAAEFVLVTQQ